MSFAANTPPAGSGSAGCDRVSGTTYLDDPEHAWVVDPASFDANADVELDEFLRRMARSDLLPHEMELIVRGASGLYRRSDGTAAECLHTAMVWFYG